MCGFDLLKLMLLFFGTALSLSQTICFSPEPITAMIVLAVASRLLVILDLIQ